MKLFVQVPCLNEEATLGDVLASVPNSIPGVDSVEILIIDDGSTDGTVRVAEQFGVVHIVRHATTMGLARSFKDGIDYALAHGADIVVSTDGDNQYPQARIPDLVEPILAGRADIVIADRQTRQIAHFSPFKRLMQRVGSRVVSRAAGTSLPDAASGFRAYSRLALLRLNVITTFSYAMESIIQAGNKRLRIESVPVTTNPKTRESRLFRNIWHHMAKSANAIARSYLMFKPHVVLGILGSLMMAGALIPIVRFLAFVMRGDSEGHIQSLVLGSALLVGSLLCFALLVLADLQRTNRELIEDLLERTRREQCGESARVSTASTGAEVLRLKLGPIDPLSGHRSVGAEPSSTLTAQ
jgi:glycosyltransferase involved in cell wall biosynthesis